jgi:molybdopterin-binding protein
VTVKPQLFTPREAAQRLGVSYPAVKRWILAGKLKSVRTPGGHHRLTLDSLNTFLAGVETAQPDNSADAMPSLSTRNQLQCKILGVRVDGIIAQVLLAVGDQQITSFIPAEMVRDFQLRAGESALAVMSPSDVMLILPHQSQRGSPRQPRSRNGVI